MSNYFTEGGYATERDSAAAFDRLLGYHTASFQAYSEVPGRMVHCRPGQTQVDVRIDRILVPRRSLLQAGWTIGSVGVELKRSGRKLGVVVSQSLDYRCAVFQLPKNGNWIFLDQVCIWPFACAGGDLASIMSQWRIGGVRQGYAGRLEFYLGQQHLLTCQPSGDIKIGHGHRQNMGRRVGSR